MLAALCAAELHAQSTVVEDSIDMYDLQQIEVVSTRARTTTPVAYTDITREEIERNSYGQDIPFLLALTPSMVATTETGIGIGATSMRLRGTDATRLNVTANGVPLNNPDSHAMYWYDTPDFISAVGSVQVQRGAGTSTNGTGAFGGAINMTTSPLSPDFGGDASLSYGSYNTNKQAVHIGSGLMGGHWLVDARLTHIGSDGYVDRGATDLKSYMFQGAYYDILEDVPVNTYDPEGFSKDENGYITYTEDGVYVTKGVDVSVHQGTIDWQQVADAGFDFAMIRVGYRGYGTEGNMRGDTQFVNNVQGALDAGLDVGIYYFSQAITVEEARQEAAYVIEQIAPYRITYPVVFDWERQNYAGSRTQTIPDTGLLCSMANAFCADIEAAGYEAMIYFYQNLAYNNLDLSQLLDYPFWLAQYTDYPSFYYDFDMWQYTSSGKVPGISGNVDLNLRFFRDGELPPEDSGDVEDTPPSQDIPSSQDGAPKEENTESGISQDI